VFGKKKQVTNNASLKRVNHAPSIISEDMRLTGSIISQGEVQLDGRIDGDISLNASEVNIKNNAHVHGDIFHDTLSIEAGAIIEGNLKQRFEKESLTLINDESKPVSDVKPLINEDDIGLSFVNKQASNKS